MLKTTITKDQSRDTGMAMVLLLLILYLSLHDRRLLLAAVGAHVWNMILPNTYKPIAAVWLGFAEFLGGITAKILMSAIFILVVMPMGVVRRALGRDSLQVRSFKKNQASAMWERNHKFVLQDIDRPY